MRQAVLKWHGGKYYLAPRIVALMPRHIHYVEPYGGGLSVLLARNPDDERLWVPGHKGVSEVVNDIDKDLTNFWMVLQNAALFRRFQEMCEATPLSKGEWQAACAMLATEINDDDYELAIGQAGASELVRAHAFFVCCRQSLAGRMDAFTSITRARLRRRMNGNVSEWLSAVAGLPDVHARLQRVLILNALPAMDVIRQEDTKFTLLYLDPPYVPESRTVPDVYKHEMTLDEHRDLLGMIRQCKGKVMLSGYANALYDYVLSGWNRHTFDLANHSGSGKKKQRRQEVLWCNF